MIEDSIYFFSNNTPLTLISQTKHPKKSKIPILPITKKPYFIER
jgi:hypothetical protein